MVWPQGGDSVCARKPMIVWRCSARDILTSETYMILTCPNCGTSFNVPDGAIGPDGRKVKCANCAHMWHAMPTVVSSAQPATQQVPPAPPQQPASPPAQPPAPEPVPTPEPVSPAAVVDEQAAWPPENQQAAPSGPLADAAADDDFDGVPAATYASDEDKADNALPSSIGDIDLSFGSNDGDLATDLDEDGSFMSRIAQGAADAGLGDIENLDDDLPANSDMDAVGKSSRGKRFVTGFKDTRPSRIGWLLLFVLWVGVFGTALGFPDVVQKYWPKSKEIYELIHKSSLAEQLADNVEEVSEPLGEREEKPGVLLTSANIDQDGVRPYLIVEGYVYNGGEGPTKVPAVQLQLLINRGKGFELFDTYEFAPLDGIMTRATRVRFRECIANYPPGNLQMNAIVIDRVSADGLTLPAARPVDSSCEDELLVQE